MRFIPNGPSLPDDLLMARDNGQVLFFCGAGVSYAKAKLPNFSGLAEQVLSLLGSAMDSPARRLFDVARQFENESGLKGLVATDRIFGLLEREFEVNEVREAVATALKPKPSLDLDAHRILLDLSRTRGGSPRLVTTNFDLLFEECEPGISSFNPPRLPDPNRDNDFHGIIHLHGRVDKFYHAAQDDEFVLSSSDFGHAYLSDGWATRYIQALLQRFRIVFVGYSADDPPVQYLLEALNRFGKPTHPLYAFHAGESAQAAAQWTHKGVNPISYDDSNDHAALWQTLSAWSERARDVGGWHDRLLERAAQGPTTMESYERGMIAHLASTSSGSRYFSKPGVILPSEWLLVFDRAARYGDAGRISIPGNISDFFDPFEAYGLDSDAPPKPIDPDKYFERRAAPNDAWDGMKITPADREELPVGAVSQLIGGALHVPNLPSRLAHLGWWIVTVAHEPTTLWWAAGQAPLHSHIQKSIDQSLPQPRYSPAIREGWRNLLTCWQQGPIDPDLNRHIIEEKARLDGWTHQLIREAISLYRPRLTVKPSFASKPPIPHSNIKLEDVIRIDVDYPRPHTSFEIPANMLEYAVALFRQELEYAVQLELEVGGGLIYFDSIRPDDGYRLDENRYGLTGHLITFTNLVEKLGRVDHDAACREIARWSGRDPVFTQLRIWSAGCRSLTTSEMAGRIFLDLDDQTFWSYRSEIKRDLLFAFRDRWSDLSQSTVESLERRLLEGYLPWSEGTENQENLSAYSRLNRLHWLSTQGVTFLFDYEAEITKLSVLVPEWTEKDAAYIAEPGVSTLRQIKSDTSSDVLDGLPIGEVLDKAKELGNVHFDSQILQQPFLGLVKNRLTRGVAVLSDASRKGRFEPWAWRVLLSSESMESASLRMLSVVGHRLARLPSPQLLEIAPSVSEWMEAQSERLLVERSQLFDLVWDALIRALSTESDAKWNSKPERRWVDESRNRSAGRMVRALFKDPRMKTFEPKAGLPAAWVNHLDQALSLPGDHGLHAIVIISSRLNSLFDIDPGWAERKMLPKADCISDESSSAFWAGYLWGSAPSQPPLYERLKPALIKLARNSKLSREHANKLAEVFLAGWVWGDEADGARQMISDIDLREVLIHASDDLRTRVLSLLKLWAINSSAQLTHRLIPFLIQVWPKQRALRSEKMSQLLVDLAVSIPDRFPEIVEAILPRLVQIKGGGLSFLGIEDTVVAWYPCVFLDLLWTVLGEDAANWPYKTSDMLAQLAEQAETQENPKLVELQRRERRV